MCLEKEEPTKATSETTTRDSVSVEPSAGAFSIAVVEGWSRQETIYVIKSMGEYLSEKCESTPRTMELEKKIKLGRGPLFRPLPQTMQTEMANTGRWL